MRNNSGNFATFAATRLASSLLSNFAAESPPPQAAIPRRRPVLPLNLLETLWPTACSAIGQTIRKPERIWEPTANVIPAPERREASAAIQLAGGASLGCGDSTSMQALAL